MGDDLHTTRATAIAELVDDVDVAIWEMDVATFHMLYVSAGIEQLLGYPRAAWLDEPSFWEDHLHPEDHDETLAACTHASRDGVDHQLEYRMIHADGRTVWINDLVRVVGVGTPRPRARGVMVDVTDRKAAELRLRRSEEHFRFVVENTSDVVTVLAPSADVTYVSPSVERLLGRSPEEVVGETAFRFVHQADRERVERAFADALSSPGFSPPVEYRIHCADGSVRVVQSIGKQHLDGRVLVTTRDVTDHHETTARLNRRDRQLHEMHKLDALGRLAAGVAHDFNNLLQVIGGRASLLEDELAALPAAQRSVRDISNAAATAAKLTNQLLMFSRSRHEDQTIVEVTQALADLEPLLRRLVPGSKTLALELPTRPITIPFAPGALEQVVMNLVINAADATPDDGTIRVRAAIEQAHVVLTVTDDGAGIAPDVLPTIFEPLFTTKPRGKGTGLGLAVVRDILEKYGASIAVESELGRGATFRVEFAPRA